MILSSNVVVKHFAEIKNQEPNFIYQNIETFIYSLPILRQ